MQTEVHEIAERIYRLSTFVQAVTPQGFSFNQFLIDADEPMLFHCGHRAMFPLIAEAAARVVPMDRLRWISFGHVEADESGSMNQWLAAAPNAQVVHGQMACEISLNDLADRPPRALGDGEALDLGGRRARFVYTPHVPHGWEAGVFYEEVTGTLLCGDLFTAPGRCPPLTSSDIVGPAIEAERMFGAMTMHPGTGAVLERLASLAPRRLGLMHGPSFEGDGGAALRGLAAGLG
jgi:flavorubredoxin